MSPSFDFIHTDILSVRQFTRGDVQRIFQVADEMRAGQHSEILKGKILANLFYEPSTRTQASFMSAMQRLGGGIIPISEVRYSSVSKGESLPDTVRTLECYSDVIVLRHHEVGAAAIAAEAAKNRLSMQAMALESTPPRPCLICIRFNKSWAPLMAKQ